MDTINSIDLNSAEDKDLINLYLENYPNKDTKTTKYPEICTEIEKIARKRQMILCLGLAISEMKQTERR